MSLFVVDASVVIKWFVHEIHAADAYRLLTPEHDFVAPDLLFAEMASILCKKTRNGDLSEREATQVLDDLRSSSLPTVPCRELASAAYSLSIATGRSAYDSMYLALAIRLDTRLITADAKFFNAINPLPLLAPHISFIADS
ncbi:MAG TPA: type II toxin-antitoxin system VapC family toxin [Thermoanaerobaculia bacterium]|nr:type II toxin-antitoxin system VapC family toxin [Thermoanaerobaculia bacterium]